MEFYAESIWNCSKPIDINFEKIGGEKLSAVEKVILKSVVDHFSTAFTKPFLIDKTLKNERDMNNFTSLVKKGLLERVGEGFRITLRVAESLFHDQDMIANYDGMSQLAHIIKTTDIVKKDLFFSKESKEDIEHLYTMLSRKGFSECCKILRKKKRNPAIMSLLWGKPGTGKTETVKQLALETGRDLIVFDVSKVTTHEWGGTEKLYKAVFREYSYLNAVMSATPILLLNEADNILSKRIANGTKAIDKAENIVSNILLEELENFKGILLATTNLVGSMDDAFDRRFLFKTELGKPDKSAQREIWHNLIPDLTAQNCEFLAEKYNMTGAQINNVAVKRDLAELYFDGDRGLQYIESLCLKETCSEKTVSKKITKIGFTY